MRRPIPRRFITREVGLYGGYRAAPGFLLSD